MNRRVIAKQTIRSFVRDKAALITGILVMFFLAVSLGTGYESMRFHGQQQEQAQHEANALWATQGERNPHSAAHYGTYAFRPISGLQILDPGITAFKGSTLYLEGHRQHAARHSQAEDRGSDARFGELTPVFLFAYILPLLMLIFVNRNVQSEREFGTLRLLVSQGVSEREIVSGKIAGFRLLVVLAVAPFLVLAFALALLTADSLLWSLGLTSLFAVAWLVYLDVFLLLSVRVALAVRNATQSLVLLLGLWVLITLLVPRVAADVANQRYSIPDDRTFFEAIRLDLSQGVDGHDPFSEHSVAFRDSVLASHGVDRVEDLPFNFRGMLLQEGERYEKQIYDLHFDRLREQYASQHGVVRRASFLSPYLSAKTLSMALARTDLHAHLHFVDEAETFRFELMEILNTDLMVHGVFGQPFVRDGTFFDENPRFEATLVPASDTLRRSVPELSILLFWWMVLLLFMQTRYTYLPRL